MLDKLILLIMLVIFAGCQASGGGATGGGIISGHTVVDDKFTLTTPTNVTYGSGQTIPLYLTFPVSVSVSGTPKLTVTIGATVVDADFVSVSGNVLTFEYVVQGADFDNNGISVSTTLNKNGGSVIHNGSFETSTVISVPSLSTVQVNGPAGAAPVASNITPPNFNEDTSSTVTLSYSDADGDLATSCTVGGLNKVTVTSACACAAGVCTVGITGALNQNGAAFFTYTVTSLGQTSNTAMANFSLNPVADAPVANNITPAAFNEDAISTITLSYSDGEGDLAVSCSTSALTNVTVTTPCACAVGVCTVSVQGTADYTGAASFGYTVTANGQTSNTATATLSITAVNDAPVAANITPPAFNEDVQSIITLSYTDAEGALATSCALSGLTNVTVSQACACAAGVCTVGVTGGANYFGAASFNYTVTAGGQASNSASATLSITAVDDAPVASNINPGAAVPRNTQTILTLVYTDVESHLASSCSVAGLTNVTVTQACACAAGTCTVGVTGTLNYTGTASFTYDVTANTLTSNTATATFNISGGTPPVATNITPANFNEDTLSTITLSYTDADSDQATTCTISALSNITVTNACACAAGVCTVGVTGSSNYFGTAGFDYTVTALGDVSNTATATLTIDSIDDAPVAANITPASIPRNQQGIITLSYTDVESDQATVCSISGASNVTETQACACAAGVCTVGVTGTLNYTGAATFNYTVTANGSPSNSATASFMITSTPPVTTDISPVAFNEDTQSVVTLAYTDADSDQATACSVTSLTNVTATQACACAAGVCTVGVTGTANYNGSGASFAFTVTAGGDLSNSSTATLSITAVDDAPVATNITPASFAKNVQSIMTLAYTDVESHLATTCSISNLSNVTVTQPCACSSGTCTVGVTGTTGYSGAASFDYTVTANSLTSNTASSSFTITNTAPVASNVTPPVFNEDTQSIITLSYSDADGDLATTCTTSLLSNVTVTQPCACAAGTCTVGVTGTLNHNGAASFGFTVTAVGQTSNVATANLSITAVDDAPTGVALTPAAFNEDTASSISLTYTDVDGHQATSCTISALSNVTVTTPCTCTLGACTVGVTGTAHYNGVASFNYTVTANGLTSVAQPANLTITSVLDAPTTANLTPAAFNEDTQSVITLTHTVVGGDTATTCAITAPTNVTVTQACACAAGVCTVGVTGTANYSGAASFNWTVSAGSAQSTSRSATLTINPADDAASLGAIATQNSTPNTATSAIAFTFNDPDGAVCTTARLSMSSSNTTLVPNANVVFAGTAPNCTATITPAANQTGSTTITITATDGGLGNKTTSFTLNINGGLLRWEFPISTVVTTYSFGTPGANTTVTLRVRNYGNATTGAITFTDNNGSNRLAIQSETCTTLTANSTCDVVVEWDNAGPGGVRTEIYTATATNTSAAITVSGTK